ncbi:hypothetical protein ONE63_002281 [Megalurothrips usitatus]|uniref:Uncharacterized protein n=1 Tax=Megalurothrips usitatus TaxID=439358 RepID=A0AAV7X7P1_9NEOP|nr:hypothetical protein ONE63_002281 [Megalurothrips usitatus]
MTSTPDAAVVCCPREDVRRPGVVVVVDVKTPPGGTRGLSPGLTA